MENACSRASRTVTHATLPAPVGAAGLPGTEPVAPPIGVPDGDGWPDRHADGKVSNASTLNQIVFLTRFDSNAGAEFRRSLSGFSFMGCPPTMRKNARTVDCGA